MVLLYLAGLSHTQSHAREPAGCQLIQNSLGSDNKSTGSRSSCILYSSRLAWACPHGHGCSRRVQTETLKSVFTVLYGSPFVNITLIKKTHMAKLRVRRQGNRPYLFSENYQITWERSLDTGEKRHWSYWCNQSATSWQWTHWCVQQANRDTHPSLSNLHRIFLILNPGTK